MLKHQENYQAMQKDVTFVVESMHSFIHVLNKKIHVHTPFLHDTIRARRGKKNKRRYIYTWERFEDGLHPPNDKEDPKILLNEWLDIILNAVKLNAELEDSDAEETTKIDWKYPSKRPKVV